VDETKEHMQATVDNQNLTNALQRVVNMPFDASAKRDIKSLIRLG